jgi:hypothetical protein
VHFSNADCYNYYSILFDLYEIEQKNKNIQFVYFSRPEAYPSIKKQIDKGKIIIPEINLQNHIPQVLFNNNLNLDSLLNLSAILGFIDSTFLFAYKFYELYDVNAYKILSVLREIKFYEKKIEFFDERYDDIFDSEFSNFLTFQDKFYSVHSDSIYQIDLHNKVIKSFAFLDSAEIYNIIKEQSGSTKSALKYFEIKRSKSKHANYLNVSTLRSFIHYPFLLTYSTISYPIEIENIDVFDITSFFTLLNLENKTRKNFFIKYDPNLKLEYLLTNQLKNDVEILLIPIVDDEKNEITLYEFNLNTRKEKKITQIKLPFKIYSGDFIKKMYSYSNNFVFFKIEPYLYKISSNEFFNLAPFLNFFNIKGIVNYTIYHPIVPEIIIKSTDYLQLYAHVDNDLISILFSYNNLFFCMKTNLQFELIELGITNKLPVCLENFKFISKNNTEFYYLNKENRQIYFYQLLN